MNTLIEYVREENIGKDGRTTIIPTAVFVADQEGDNVRVGFSACHTELDMFDKRLGKNIALGRAIKLETAEKVEVPERIYDRFISFLDRCKKRPSFQGKNFPSWVGDDCITPDVTKKLKMRSLL